MLYPAPNKFIYSESNILSTSVGMNDLGIFLGKQRNIRFLKQPFTQGIIFETSKLSAV